MTAVSKCIAILWLPPHVITWSNLRKTFA